MRALLSKVMTGSMIAGAALLVSACGGTEDAGTNNTAMTEVDATDTMLDGGTNDVTAIDAGTGMDTNMSMDMNTMGADANMAGGNMMGTGEGANTGAVAGATTNGM